MFSTVMTRVKSTGSLGRGEDRVCSRMSNDSPPTTLRGGQELASPLERHYGPEVPGAMTMHFHFSQQVIPECNKTVWPLCLAPSRPNFIDRNVVACGSLAISGGGRNSLRIGVECAPLSLTADILDSVLATGQE